MPTFSINNMEVLSDSCCRICLKTSLKLTSLYSTDEYEVMPRKMLFSITGIRLEDEEENCEVPRQICRNCVCELNLAYQFRCKALEAQTVIENYYNQLNIEDNKIADQADNPNEEEEELNREQQPLNGRIPEAVEVVERIYPEESEPPSNSIEHHKSESECRKSKIQSPLLRQLRRHNKEPLNSNEKSNFRPLSKRGRKPKTPATGEQETTSFICDICGNVFSKRSRLTEHLYRHQTELRYSCELCGDRFLLRENLRKHMFHHVGAKPFKCNYCSRTFYYMSGKKRHEAIHAGSKPFICKSCGKAFGYPHSLKKHELIHEDTKLFNCNYCNKVFRLPHHLKQHEATILHRNAVYAAERANSNKHKIT